MWGFGMVGICRPASDARYTALTALSHRVLPIVSWVARGKEEEGRKRLDRDWVTWLAPAYTWCVCMQDGRGSRVFFPSSLTHFPWSRNLDVQQQQSIRLSPHAVDSIISAYFLPHATPPEAIFSCLPRGKQECGGGGDNQQHFVTSYTNKPPTTWPRPAQNALLGRLLEHSRKFHTPQEGVQTAYRTATPSLSYVVLGGAICLMSREKSCSVSGKNE